jgi:hypothetical protein
MPVNSEGLGKDRVVVDMEWNIGQYPSKEKDEERGWRGIRS